jgi:hypothetical protein
MSVEVCTRGLRRRGSCATERDPLSAARTALLLLFGRLERGVYSSLSPESSACVRDLRRLSRDVPEVSASILADSQGCRSMAPVVSPTTKR